MMIAKKYYIMRMIYLGVAAFGIFGVVAAGRFYDGYKARRLEEDLNLRRKHTLKLEEVYREKIKRQERENEEEWKRRLEERRKSYTNEEEKLLARAIFGEARGKSNALQTAVAYTVLERKENKRWSNNLSEVILQPRQYSCFNEEDPNYPKVWNPEQYEPAEWSRARDAAKRVLNRQTENPVPGATHYHSRGPKKRPFWTQNMTLIRVVDGVEFYRL